MPKRPLKDRIYAYCQARPGVRIPSGEIQRLVTEKTSYTAANATRRLRELAEDGLLSVEYVKNHAHYTYEPPASKRVRRVKIEDGKAVEYWEEISSEVTN